MERPCSQSRQRTTAGAVTFTCTYRLADLHLPNAKHLYCERKDFQGLATGEVNAAVVACRFRPRYPKQVYDIMLSHLKDNQRNLAVDVATGSGQAAVQLAEHFKQVCTSLAHVDSLALPPTDDGTS